MESANAINFPNPDRRESASTTTAVSSPPAPSQINQNDQKNKENAMEILWWIIVGLVAGWATGKIMKGSGYGFIVDTLLGIAGAVVGGFIARHLGFGSHGMIVTILIAIGGAVILVFIFRLITGKK
jgi:uncharacterized membrane protein YeaQ/YmgE (transglycosylase-associated protein family)